MGLDTSYVLVGAPDQSTTGAICTAPIGTALPTSASDILNTAFKDSGYVSDDGLELNIDISTNDIADWAGSIIRKVAKSSDNTIDFSLISADKEGLCQCFGDENVTATAANATHGAQLAVSLGATLPAPKSWAFKMKDGIHKVLLVLPNAQLTKWGKINFKASDAIKLNPTLSCYPDASGKSVYIYFDDGKTVSA